ncbi:MAG: SIS domain-containing protein [Candidatus Omnitrophica bacterium]|nr:SIS domain-containing protein [Candidatus Omnitrophota bacterium]
MEYFKELAGLFSKIEIRGQKGQSLSFDQAVSGISRIIAGQAKKGAKVILIGNGGSASIASHIATDFLKNCSLAALAFNDPSLITCLGNDLGYEYVFQKPLEMLSQKGDILFSISSSGKSKNILNATAKAGERGCFIITLSGFDRDNPLRKLGDINFYAPSDSYGYVEITHLAICHAIADKLTHSTASKPRPNGRGRYVPLSVNPERVEGLTKNG